MQRGTIQTSTWVYDGRGIYTTPSLDSFDHQHPSTLVAAISRAVNIVSIWVSAGVARAVAAIATCWNFAATRSATLVWWTTSSKWTTVFWARKLRWHNIDLPVYMSMLVEFWRFHGVSLDLTVGSARCWSQPCQPCGPWAGFKPAHPRWCALHSLSPWHTRSNCNLVSFSHSEGHGQHLAVQVVQISSDIYR